MLNEDKGLIGLRLCRFFNLFESNRIFQVKEVGVSNEGAGRTMRQIKKAALLP